MARVKCHPTLGVACQVSCLWGDISTSAVVSASRPLKLRYAASTNWLHRSKGCNVASCNRDAMPRRVVSCMVYPYGCHVVFSVRDTHKLRPLLVHAVVARCMPRCNSGCHLMSRRRESTAAATRCSLTACRAAAVLQRRVLCCAVATQSPALLFLRRRQIHDVPAPPCDEAHGGRDLAQRADLRGTAAAAHGSIGRNTVQRSATQCNHATMLQHGATCCNRSGATGQS